MRLFLVRLGLVVLLLYAVAMGVLAGRDVGHRKPQIDADPIAAPPVKPG